MTDDNVVGEARKEILNHHFDIARASISRIDLPGENPTKNLQELIKSGRFDYVNSEIMAENTPLLIEEIRTDLEILHFDHAMKSDEIIKEMANKGLRPANAYELLQYAEKEWNGQDAVVALGSVWVASDGSRDVLCLCDLPVGRSAVLRWYDFRWGQSFRFPAVPQVPSGTQTLSHGQPLAPASYAFCPHCGVKL